MITIEELRSVPLFAALPDDEAEALAARLADVRLREGDWLIHEGEQPSFFMVIEGSLELRKVVHGIERHLDDYRAGTYFGEVPLLLGAPAIASLRAREPSRVARLEQADFTSLFSMCETFAAELARTMTHRLTRLQDLAKLAPPPTVTIVGHRYDIACHHLRDFLLRNRVVFRWHDPAHPKSVDGFAPPDPGDRFPMVILPDGGRLVTPTLRELAQRLGLQTVPGDSAYDLAIIGAGPAGLAAAVYGASEGLRTLLLEREAPGGQAGTSSRIENYLGFPTGLSGDELSGRALQQARRFGTELLVAREVVALEPDAASGDHAIVLDGGDRVRARAVIIAAGVAWRELDVPGAETLVGRGIYYGAARTEAMGCTGQHVFLVGGGNSAGQAAMFFASYARRVTLLVRGPSLAASMSHYLIQQLATQGNIEVRTHCRIIRVEGEHHLESIVIEYRDTGELITEPAKAVFAFIGADARTEWLPAPLIRDDQGFVCTGRDVMDLVAQRQGNWPLARDPFLLETSVPGIFAAGDVRHGSIKRVASGVGEGSMSIAFVHQYIGAQPARPASNIR
ncbi:MAG: FAD-dependent oxidoreductase [Casimicrobiaceae bacterium]